MLGSLTLTIDLESATRGAVPDVSITVNAGTAQTGVFQAIDSVNFTSADDSAWTLIVNADGTADLVHSGTVMATRAAGCAWDPTGAYESTSDGATACNSGDPWIAYVSIIPRLPRTGQIYLHVTETGGVLTAAEGPFFATTAPAQSGDDYYPVVAHCDVSSVTQRITGPIVWPG